MQEYRYEIRNLAGTTVEGGKLNLKTRPQMGETVRFLTKPADHRNFLVQEIVQMANMRTDPLLVLVSIEEIKGQSGAVKA